MSKKQSQNEKPQEEKSLQQSASQSLTVDNSHLEFKGNESADAGDILIPRILLMQGTSKWVPDQFNMGEIIDSVDEVVLAKKGEKITVIPFFMKKTWQVFTREQPPAWVREEKWDASNDSLDWQFTEEDPDRGTVELSRQRNYGFYCFILGEDGTIDDFAIPAIVNFRSSSGFKEGKKIASWFGRMKSLNQPGFTVSWDISSESVKDGDKAYQKFIVSKGKNVTKEQMEPIYKWLELLNTASNIREHQVDEGDVVETSTTNVQAGEVSAQAQF